MKKATSCLLVITYIVLVCGVFIPQTVNAALSTVCNITFSENSYTEDESVVGINGWSVVNTMRANDSAVVTVDPDDANNKVLKITTPEKGSAATPIYKLAVSDLPDTGVLNVSYRIKLKPYETDRATWAWSDHFGSLDISNADGTLTQENIARFRFNGNNKSRDTDTTIAYYAYKADGTKYSSSYIRAIKGSTDAAFAKTTLYNSWAKVDEHLDFDTNEYYFTITYTDMTGDEIKMVYTMGTEGTSYSPMYFDGTTEETIGAYKKMDYINFGISPKTGTGVMYVDDIVISRGYPDCTVAVSPGTLGTTSEFSLEFSNEVNVDELNGIVSVVDSDGNDVDGAACSLNVVSTTEATVSITGLEYETSYALVLDNSFYDVYGQTMLEPYVYEFTTMTEAEGNKIISIDFEDETLYPLNSSVGDNSQWSVDLRSVDKATIVTDPYNPANKVLAIETDNTTNLNKKSTIDLDLGDVSVNGIVQMSYKLRLVDETPFTRYWSDSFGKLQGILSDGTTKPAMYFSFNKGQDNLVYMGYTYTPSTGEFKRPYNNVGNISNWVQFTQRLNLSTIKVKLDATTLDNFKTPVTNKQFGYDSDLYFRNNLDLMFKNLSSIQFSLAPPSLSDNADFAELAPTLGKSVLYVDDIEIIRIPELTAAPAFDVENTDPESPLRINFSNPVSEENLADAFVIKEAGSDTAIPNKLNVTLSDNKRFALIEVEGDLKFNATDYVLEIDNVFKDSYGEVMSSPASISFTTMYSANCQVSSFDSVVCTKAGEASTMAEADKIVVTTKLFNNGATSETPLVLVAAYNENGRMLGFNVMSGISVSPGVYSEPATFNISLAESGASQIKAFVWRSSSKILLNHFPYIYNQ